MKGFISYLGRAVAATHRARPLRYSGCAAPANIACHAFPDFWIGQFAAPVLLDAGVTELGVPDRHSLSIPAAEQICPDVQNPHWKPSRSMKAA
jgi:hypothetical protein